MEPRSFSWLPIKGYVNGEDHYEYTIMKVEIPCHVYDVFYEHLGYKTIWEFQEETKQQKQIRELEDIISKASNNINQAKSQIEALKKEV